MVCHSVCELPTANRAFTLLRGGSAGYSVGSKMCLSQCGLGPGGAGGPFVCGFGPVPLWLLHCGVCNQRKYPTTGT
jgi:hypothetical protein